MPLIAWLVIAYLAGLLAGFAGVPGAAGIGLGVVAIIAASQQALKPAVVAGLCIAGLWSARSARESNERCIRLSSARHEVLARLDRDIEPGGFSPAALTTCPARISIFAAQGSAPAGAV